MALFWIWLRIGVRPLVFFVTFALRILSIRSVFRPSVQWILLRITCICTGVLGRFRRLTDCHAVLLIRVCRLTRKYPRNKVGYCDNTTATISSCSFSALVMSYSLSQSTCFPFPHYQTLHHVSVTSHHSPSNLILAKVTFAEYLFRIHISSHLSHFLSVQRKIGLMSFR